MMDWTDRHCRFFHRLLTRRALLYTEMLTTGAVLHGDRARLLRFDAAEHSLALQLGGSDPRALRILDPRPTRMVNARSCDEIVARQSVADTVVSEKNRCVRISVPGSRAPPFPDRC